jgi:hypothetical protein
MITIMINLGPFNFAAETKRLLRTINNSRTGKAVFISLSANNAVNSPANGIKIV